MDTYEDFAFLYDDLMNQVPYEKWVEFIVQQFKQNPRPINLVCDLGCGTGNVTLPLASYGYDMIGIDLSENMLMIAREKAFSENISILYLLQDMQAFELYGTVDAIISVCDSCNYIDAIGLKKVFDLVHNYLDSGGLFIFDLNTRYKFERVFNNQTFSEVGEDFATIWENNFDPKHGTNDYFLTCFVEEEGVYSRFEEHHTEYTHDMKDVVRWLHESGLTLVQAVEEYSLKPVKDTTERITFIVTK
jgi:SAM-dependent methyltransferase